MKKNSLDDFDKFVIHTKTLELLDRYGIRPTNVWVDVNLDPDDNKVLFALANRSIGYSDKGTLATNDSEHQQSLLRMRSELGVEDGTDVGVFENYEDLYDKLCAAIERAPKSFTRLR